MSRFTALIASLAVVTSVSVAAAGPAVVAEGEQLIVSTQSLPPGIASLPGLSTTAIVGGVLVTTLLVGIVVDNNSSGSH